MIISKGGVGMKRFYKLSIILVLLLGGLLVGCNSKETDIGENELEKDMENLKEKQSELDYLENVGGFIEEWEDILIELSDAVAAEDIRTNEGFDRLRDTVLKIRDFAERGKELEAPSKYAESNKEFKNGIEDIKYVGEHFMTAMTEKMVARESEELEAVNKRMEEGNKSLNRSVELLKENL